MSAETKWVTVRIPKELNAELEKIQPSTTFPNKSQIISAAIRRYLDDIRRNQP